MDDERIWRAFCTTYWFITGIRIIADSRHPWTGELLNWYDSVELRVYLRDTDWEEENSDEI